MRDPTIIITRRVNIYIINWCVNCDKILTKSVSILNNFAQNYIRMSGYRRKLLFVFTIIFQLIVIVVQGTPVFWSNFFLKDTLQYPDEVNLKNVQQLTFGGDNAEAYFSFDGKWLVFSEELC